MENLSLMLAPLFNSKLLIVLFFGTLFGLILGVLPGLGPTTGGALILPFTMTLDPLSAVVLLTSIYCAGTYGGAITAILINTPGTPAAAATCLDGYPLAQKGEAGRALGMATVSSVVGGIFSVIVLVFFAPLLAKLAYEFGQPEYFALAISILSIFVSYYWGERRVLYLLLVSIIFPIIVFIFFETILGLRFPGGIITNLYYY